MNTTSGARTVACLRFPSDISGNGSVGATFGSHFEVLPEDAVDRSLCLRLAFLYRTGNLDHLIAPLLVLQIWKATRENVVIAYPDLPTDCLLTAQQMLDAGCEAVLLNHEDRPPVVFGVAYKPRVERILRHWADRLAQLSLSPPTEEQLDLALNGRMVEHICDKVGMVRDPRTDPTPPELFAIPEDLTIQPLLHRAVAKLLSTSVELMQDPFANLIGVLNSPSTASQQDPSTLITNLAYFTWSERTDLRSLFDLATTEGRNKLVDWFLGRAEMEYQVSNEFLEPIRSAREINVAVTEPEPMPFESSPEVAPESFRRVDSSNGVNLIGYPRAEMGMGQQLRLCAEALSAVNVDFSVVDFQFGIVASQNDSQFEQAKTVDNPFDVNLFHINADQMPLVREKLGSDLFRNRYNVGYWEWELSEFPDEWQPALDSMDEIWAPSKFIQAAISKKTTKPVIWMPLPMEVRAPAESSQAVRERYGLPASAFLFLFAFDFSSFVTRKNFPACIRAFQQAFKESDSSVGLVLKTICHPHQDREFWNMLRAIGDDRRIYLLDRILRRNEVNELTAACDCFVSLHRSEGFGLGIAEAMYLGKPVIVTNYSGNVDFTKRDNACLIDYTLRPVGLKEYVHSEGQVWAEPDISQAAEHMRRVAKDEQYGGEIGRAATLFMQQHHSFERVGSRYRTRLAQIAQARSLLAAHPIPLDLTSAWRYR